VRSYVVHRDYTPEPVHVPRPAVAPDLETALESLDISGSELLEHYCAALYRRLGNVQAVARTVGSHRDTVKQRLARRGRAS
jgi:hypothetical protein